MNTLPVSELRFGDVNSNSGERGNFTLGSLRCKWTPDAVVPSCEALADAGLMFYTVSMLMQLRYLID